MSYMGWSIQEIKHMKWQRLIQYNILFVFLFFLSFYFVKMSKSVFPYWAVLCLLLWIIVAHTLYTYTTGKITGTKKSKLIQSFEKNNKGEKYWLRKKKKDLIVISIISILLTIFIIIMQFYFKELKITVNNIFSVILVWIAFNIGEITRIKKI